MKLFINTDGGARGNPGPAGIGVVIGDESGKVIGHHKQYIGEATNNVAEYKALILALQKVREISNSQYQILNQIHNSPPPPLILRGGEEVELEIRMDSELIVRQMQGKYKIKEPTLKLLAEEVKNLIKHFGQVNFVHIPREQNKVADKLVNEAIDAYLAKI
jgi:ribonuclease HI